MRPQERLAVTLVRPANTPSPVPDHAQTVQLVRYPGVELQVAQPARQVPMHQGALVARVARTDSFPFLPPHLVLIVRRGSIREPRRLLVSFALPVTTRPVERVIAIVAPQVSTREQQPRVVLSV